MSVRCTGYAVPLYAGEVSSVGETNPSISRHRNLSERERRERREERRGRSRDKQFSSKEAIKGNQWTIRCRQGVEGDSVSCICSVQEEEEEEGKEEEEEETARRGEQRDKKEERGEPELDQENENKAFSYTSLVLLDRT